MAFAITIRNFVMNLNTINASANNAFISVAQPRSVTNYFPFWAVCTSFSTAPKITFFSRICKSLLGFLANIRARKFLYRCADFKFSVADCAFSNLLPSSVPSAGMVAIHRAKLSIWIACRGVKTFVAMRASFLRAVLRFSWRNTNSPLVPSLLSWGFQVASAAAINFGFAPNKLRIANRAYVLNGFHIFSMKASLYRREPKYFDIACQRIENAYRQTRLFA